MGHVHERRQSSQKKLTGALNTFYKNVKGRVADSKIGGIVTTAASNLRHQVSERQGKGNDGWEEKDNESVDSVGLQDMSEDSDVEGEEKETVVEGEVHVPLSDAPVSSSSSVAITESGAASAPALDTLTLPVRETISTPTAPTALSPGLISESLLPPRTLEAASPGVGDDGSSSTKTSTNLYSAWEGAWDESQENAPGAGRHKKRPSIIHLAQESSTDGIGAANASVKMGTDGRSDGSDSLDATVGEDDSDEETEDDAMVLDTGEDQPTRCQWVVIW